MSNIFLPITAIFKVVWLLCYYAITSLNWFWQRIQRLIKSQVKTRGQHSKNGHRIYQPVPHENSPVIISTSRTELSFEPSTAIYQGQTGANPFQKGIRWRRYFHVVSHNKMWTYTGGKAFEQAASISPSAQVDAYSSIEHRYLTDGPIYWRRNWQRHAGNIERAKRGKPLEFPTIEPIVEAPATREHPMRDVTPQQAKLAPPEAP